MDFHDIEAPTGLRTPEFVLRPIRVEDAELDHAAVMESREFLRIWEQSTWPEDDFTVEANRADMHKLVDRWTNGTSFTYTVMTPDETECLGCVYLFPPDVSFLRDTTAAPTGDVAWDDLDAFLNFWVRASRLDDGLDRRLLDDLQRWLGTDWELTRWVVVTTEALEQQVEVLERSGLTRLFELETPGIEGRRVAYG